MSDTTQSPTPQLQMLDVSAIVVPEALDRWEGSAADLELRRSIEAQGLLQPVGVRALDEANYEAVWGTRRIGAWRTSEVLRARPIPALLVSAEAALRGTIDENILRRSLDTVDKARLAREAIENHPTPWTLEEAAKSLGLSESRLSRFRRVWSNPALWPRVEAGTLTMKSAIQILEVPEEARATFLARLDAEHAGASAAEVDRITSEWTGTALGADFENAGVAGRVLPLLGEILGFSPPGEKTRVHVEWVAGKFASNITLSLPLHHTPPEDVRNFIRGLQAAYVPAPQGATGTATTGTEPEAAGTPQPPSGGSTEAA